MDRVVVFVDYQNVHGWARRQFLPYGADRSDGHIHPRQLGELICSRRRNPSTLTEVRVYRGRPNPARQPGAARANDRQTSDWARSGVTVIRRNLMYPPNYPQVPATEKGIDVAIAVDMMRMAAAGELDVAVLFSCDKDLLPAVEALTETGLAHVEVVAWAKAPRLRLDGTQKPWCHYLSESDFNKIRDRFDYSAPY